MNEANFRSPPTLLVVEVAAAVARVLGDPDRAVGLAAAVRDLPSQSLLPLDGELADRALRLAAEQRLRGADAVYGAVAQRYGTVLLTYDRQQLERLPPAVAVAHPAEVLKERKGCEIALSRGKAFQASTAPC